MRHTRGTGFWRSLPRRAGRLVLLLVYLGTVIGFPLPSSGREDSPTRACGCTALSQCEGQCCCCHAGDTAKVRPCCAGGSAGRATGARWVVGVAAQKCRGMSSIWVSLGAVFPAPPAASGRPAPEPQAGRLVHPESHLVSHLSTPPVPPPRSPRA